MIKSDALRTGWGAVCKVSRTGSPPLVESRAAMAHQLPGGICSLPIYKVFYMRQTKPNRPPHDGQL